MGQLKLTGETLFLCHFAWCIARLVAPEQKLVKIFFLQIIKLIGASLQKKLLRLMQNLLSQYFFKTGFVIGS